MPKISFGLFSVPSQIFARPLQPHCSRATRGSTGSDDEKHHCHHQHMHADPLHSCRWKVVKLSAKIIQTLLFTKARYSYLCITKLQSKSMRAVHLTSPPAITKLTEYAGEGGRLLPMGLTYMTTTEFREFSLSQGTDHPKVSREMSSVRGKPVVLFFCKLVALFNTLSPSRSDFIDASPPKCRNRSKITLVSGSPRQRQML